MNSNGVKCNCSLQYQYWFAFAYLATLIKIKSFLDLQGSRESVNF